MVDGTRKRRDCENQTKSRWYAVHREQRFRRRFGWPIDLPSEEMRACCSRLAPHRPSRKHGRTIA
jgi:hypothetical protein